MCLIKKNLYRIEWQSLKSDASGKIYVWSEDITHLPIDSAKELAKAILTAEIKKVELVDTEDDD
jgi:hypothetical protein